MNASTVRWGGIAVFVGIALAILLPILLLAVLGLGGISVVSIVSNLVTTAIVVFVFWTTKGYFNARSYDRADLAILVIIAIQVLSFVLGVVFSTPAGLGAIMQGGMSAVGVGAIIVMLLSLVLVAAYILFALRCLDFGKVAGGGLWKAIGILYLIGLGLALIVLIIGLVVGLTASGATPQAAGRGAMAGGAAVVILGVVAALCYLAGIICHGVGLITGAGKMNA